MLTQSEFEAIITDTSKQIDRDIYWQEDSSHALWVNFRADLLSDEGY